MSRNKRIALTGGIGSGKSEVGRYLKDAYGFPVLDCDLISREITDRIDVRDMLKREFGECYFPNGGFLRRSFASDIFSDPDKTARLNALLHPRIFRELFLRMDREKGTVFAMVPLLYETGMQKEFDEVWLVVANENLRRKRAAERDGVGEEEIALRMKNQISDEKKEKFAHIIINNNGSREDFRRQVDFNLRNADYFENPNEI